MNVTLNLIEFGTKIDLKNVQECGERSKVCRKRYKQSRIRKFPKRRCPNKKIRLYLADMMTLYCSENTRKKQ